MGFRMGTFLEEAKSMQAEMIEWRRWLHTHAELGEKLPETKAFVKSKLESFGYTPIEMGESGLVVNIGNKSGKCILLRADMDALPMKEETDLPFACENGCTHSCGHDMHTTMLLAAAKMLKKYENELPGTIKLMFQPGEETLTGAANMVAAGILENPKVDVAITMHVNNMAKYPKGVVVVPTGGYGLSSCDSYRIDVYGKGGHGAMPEFAVDPITVAAHIHSALQELSAREIPSNETVALTQGTFHSGDAPNIIPDTAYMEGSLRTLNDELREKLLKRMETICTSIAEAFRAKATFTVKCGCSPLYNDPAVCKDVKRYLTDLLGEERLYYKPRNPVMTSEDFSNVLKHVPGLQLVLALGPHENGANMHNPKVILSEDYLYLGAAAMAQVGKSWVEDHAADC